MNYKEMIPHSNEWYDELSKRQRGYFYPWKSEIQEPQGESYFREELNRLSNPKWILLDVGCGHGDLTIEMAKECNFIYGYDRVKLFIEIAKQDAKESTNNNIKFICASSKEMVHGKTKYRIPIENIQFDLIYSRRGPVHYIEDARRLSKPGTILFQINPLPISVPKWNKELPVEFKIPETESNEIEKRVTDLLAKNEIELTESKKFFSKEFLQSDFDLYSFLGWGKDPTEIPSYAQVKTTMQQILRKYGSKKGIAIDHNRYVWKAIVK